MKEKKYHYLSLFYYSLTYGITTYDKRVALVFKREKRKTSGNAKRKKNSVPYIKNQIKRKSDKIYYHNNYYYYAKCYSYILIKLLYNDSYWGQKRKKKFLLSISKEGEKNEFLNLVDKSCSRKTIKKGYFKKREAVVFSVAESMSEFFSSVYKIYLATTNFYCIDR